MPAAKPDLRVECVRLRQEERLSVRQIHARTGASLGSVSHWVRPYPLTTAEMKALQVAPPPAVKKPRPDESELHRTTKTHCTTTSQTAKVSETAVLLRLLAQGFAVFGSVFDGDVADWVVEDLDTHRMWKIQVKTTKRNQVDALPNVSLARSSNTKRYVRGDFDFIVGFDLFEDRAYVWSWDEVEHLKSTVTVAEDAAERWDKLRA